MKKCAAILFFFLILNSAILAQVGINTTNPRSTLHILAGDSDTPAGIIAPRQSLQQLLDKSESYTSLQAGAFVYVNNVDGQTDAKTANITKIGYYYFDGNLWQQFSSSDSTNSWSFLGDDISETHGENYLGTNNDSDLVFKTNSEEQMAILSNGNIGVGMLEPTNKLHIKSADAPIKLEGLEETFSTAINPILSTSEGVWRMGSYPKVALVPSDVGTIIVSNGELIIAQEIQVLMSKDFSFSAMAASSTPIPIGNLTNKIIDTGNYFVSDETSNSFQVEYDGVYAIVINAQINTVDNTQPYIGLWNNTDSKWEVGVNDIYSSFQDKQQTYTLESSLPLSKDKTYSFRIHNTKAGSIPWESRGYTGGGPISFYSVKRLK